VTKFEKYIIAEKASNYPEVALVRGKLIKFDKFIDDVRASCRPWLSAVKNCPMKTVWRGVDGDVPFISNKKVRADRRPYSTDPSLHQAFDTRFEEVFGWKPRSSGLFVTGTSATAGMYGDTTYLVFPAGPFKFLWSDKIYDLYTQGTQWGGLNNLINKNNYKEKDICGAIASDNEIMIGCKSYYGITSMMLGLAMSVDGKGESPPYSVKTQRLANEFIKKYLL